MKGRNNFNVIFVMMSLDKTLNKHTKIIHEGKKCEICNTNFGEKGTLKKHIVGVHEGQKPLNCKICDTSFGEKEL